MVMSLVANSIVQETSYQEIYFQFVIIISPSNFRVKISWRKETPQQMEELISRFIFEELVVGQMLFLSHEHKLFALAGN